MLEHLQALEDELRGGQVSNQSDQCAPEVSGQSLLFLVDEKGVPDKITITGWLSPGCLTVDEANENSYPGFVLKIIRVEVYLFGNKTPYMESKRKSAIEKQIQSAKLNRFVDDVTITTPECYPAVHIEASRLL